MPASQQPVHLQSQQPAHLRECTLQMSLRLSILRQFCQRACYTVRACAYGVCVRAWMANDCACER